MYLLRIISKTCCWADDLILDNVWILWCKADKNVTFQTRNDNKYN